MSLGHFIGLKRNKYIQVLNEAAVSVYCCKKKLMKIDPLLFLILYFLSEIVCASLVTTTAFSCVAARAMFR